MLLICHQQASSVDSVIALVEGSVDMASIVWRASDRAYRYSELSFRW
jgi:hypothetical protein